MPDRDGDTPFRTLAEMSPDGILIHDGTRYVYANPSAARIFGVESASELIGVNATDIIAPEDRPRIAERIGRVLAGQFMPPEAVTLMRADGESVIVEASAGPVVWNDTPGVQVLWRDITERGRAAELLRKSEATLQSIMTHAPVGIGLFDADGRWIFKNRLLDDLAPGGFVPSRSPDARERFQAFDEADREVTPDHWPGARALQGETSSLSFRRESEGQTRWMQVSATPVPGSGEERGGIVIVEDITEHKKADLAVRESEEKLRRVLEIGTVAIVFFDFEGGVIEANDAYLDLIGYSRAELEAGEVRYENLTPPDWHWRDERTIAELEEKGESGPYEKEYFTRSGERIWIYCASRRLPDGSAVEFILDITERKRAEVELRERRRRERALIEGIPQLVWRARGEGSWSWASPQWSTYTGLSNAESLGFGWLDTVHRHDLAAVRSAWQGAEREEAIGFTARIRRHDGTYCWFQTRATPVRDEAGEIVEWLGTSTDIDQLRRLQESQEVMVAELQHRTRNLIAVVRSIASQTLRGAKSLDAFEEEFGGRLAALSRVQGLLSRAQETPITIGSLVRLELEALGASEEESRVQVEGPEIALRSRIVQILALALHELATNARKYGALSADGGRLKVSWNRQEREGEPYLCIEWREEGIEPAQARSQSEGGYGRKLIEQALPYSLGAKTGYHLGANMLVCTIDLPLKAHGREGNKP